VNYGELLKEFPNFDRLARKMERMWNQRTRMIIAHPDLCLFLSNFPRVDWKYMRKIGAKNGHLVVSLGWLRASIAW
jgi:hypothetical protein